MLEMKDRLRKARVEKKLSQAALSRLANVSQSAIAAIESGRNRKPTNIAVLANILGVSAYWLETGIDLMPSETLSDGIETAADIIRFERLDISAACGTGIENSGFPEVIDYVAVARAWAREKLGGNLAAIKVINAKGDSMAETVNDGDVVFVDTAETAVNDDGVYLIALGNSLRIKRIQRTVSGVVLISDNRKYREEEVKGADLEQLKIIGKVRGAWKLAVL